MTNCWGGGETGKKNKAPKKPNQSLGYLPPGRGNTVNIEVCGSSESTSLGQAVLWDLN